MNALLCRELEIMTPPFVRKGTTTAGLMWEVVAALVPIVAVAWWIFGASALLVVVAAVAGSIASEWLLVSSRKGWSTLGDGSALLTGLLLGLTLPPALPMWMAFLGGFVAIALGKAIFGGVGRNLFNPALVGRAFLQGSFPEPMVTWVPPGQPLAVVYPSTADVPFTRYQVDAVTSATPMGHFKMDGIATDLFDLLVGNTSGSLGETCGLLLLACGLWLAARRVFDWRLFVSTLLFAALFATLGHLVWPAYCLGPVSTLFAGGLMFGAVFMCTDPVTTPITPRGAWLFGLGVGFLVVFLPSFGGLPEAVMYSILLMNAATPLINRATQPRPFGGGS